MTAETSISPPTRTLYGWLRLFSSPVGAAAVTSLLALIASALMYRILPKADAGAFALLTAFVQTVLILGGLGQSTLTQRVYSRAEPGAFNWRADLDRQLLFILPVSVLISLLIAHLYQLPPWEMLFVLTGALLWNQIVTSGSILAANQRYAWASTLPRLPNGLLIIPAALIALVPVLATLDAALAGLLGAALASLALSWFALRRLKMTGDRTISLRQRGYGLVFLANQTATLVPDYLLLAAAGLVAPPEDLALYGALMLLFRPTQLLQNVLAQVLTTELARAQRPRLGRILLAFAAAAALIIVGGILLAGPATQLAYAGRYAPGWTLIALVSLASGLDVLETLPRSYLVGRASRRVLGYFGISQLAIAVIGLLIGLALVHEWGIEGAALGAVLIFIARNTVSFAGFAATRLQERPRSAAQ
jgi:O-antigen/teichoic acid export membrane protein